uniref:Beta-1,4-N-acetylgalactosaminyltransferase n=1 Tax=Hirondellea gigas TaxID=1518452 RepID=A0A2P2HZS0_9CRUS
MAPRKSVNVKYHKVFLQSFVVTLILWLVPVLQGRYVPLQYSYIPVKDIGEEMLSIREVDVIHQSAPIRQFNVHNENSKSQEIRDKVDSKQNQGSKTIGIAGKSKQLRKKFKGKNAKRRDKARAGLLPCPEVSPFLKGLELEPQQGDGGVSEEPWSLKMMEEFAERHGIQPGGFWQPPHCLPQHAVTVIVGQRNRTEQLQHFLLHMHPFLARQQLQYRIIVVDQDNNEPYNRGKILNIGYMESLQVSPPGPEQQCVVLHDVDLLPLNDLNLYACTNMPRHMTVAVDTFRFQLPYSEIAGGAVALLAAQFEAINGFSNRYSGWGGEDDDFNNRINNQGLHMVRLDPRVSQYAMLRHKPAVESPTRYQFLDAGSTNEDADDDGLTSLRYTLSAPPDRHPLMMHYTVHW